MSAPKRTCRQGCQRAHREHSYICVRNWLRKRTKQDSRARYGYSAVQVSTLGGDPRGLTFTQLRDVLSTAFASPELLGASVVILNPNRDPTGGQAATQVTKFLADALRPQPQR